MILFFSDLHLGRGDDATRRKREAELVTCLQRQRSTHPEPIDHLYLVGDVFDQYIEYRHLIPKGFARFQGLLARWSDCDIPITYLVGNHDPWHRDYFQRELGIRLVFDALLEPARDVILYLTHGDDVAARVQSYGALRPLLRHPVPVWMYRTLLPADAGLALARWVNQRAHADTPDPEVVDALRSHAQQILQTTAAHVAVMGHSHVPELSAQGDGYYLNTGNWHESRTFGRLDDDGLHLLRWNGTEAASLNVASFS